MLKKKLPRKDREVRYYEHGGKYGRIIRREYNNGVIEFLAKGYFKKCVSTNGDYRKYKKFGRAKKSLERFLFIGTKK